MNYTQSLALKQTGERDGSVSRDKKNGVTAMPEVRLVRGNCLYFSFTLNVFRFHFRIFVAVKVMREGVSEGWNNAVNVGTQEETGETCRRRPVLGR